MFSVICPTMWRGAELATTLPLIENCPSVGEIILIDNDKNHVPAWFSMIGWRKVKLVRPNSNLFVNPAFNVGVRLAKHNAIALMQDDVVFDSNIFTHLLPHMKSTTPVIGCDVKTILQQSPPSVIPVRDIEVEECPLPLVPGWAVLMCIHKSNWLPINEELKIHLGEEWIAQSHIHRGLKPLIMRNFFLTAHGCMKTSGLPEFMEHQHREEKMHNWIKEQVALAT